ncbi:MAG: polysaccharide biosynthesis/export family protein [Candidatus Sumerlaeia bacterium]|nr:polysaccharide biosynthesis/export family protein [Candidatus Sumerlaeia bacterium]
MSPRIPAFALPALAGLLASCSPPPPQAPQFFNQPRIVDTHRHELQVGDVLEFVYTIGPQAPTTVGDYTINVNDSVRVEFAYTPEFNREVIVRPDGKITLPIIGEVIAYGKTPSQLAEELTELYTSELRNPFITVDVPEFTSLTEQVARSIITPQGTTRNFVYPVRPDGMVTLVAIGDVQAFGKTVPELSAAIAEAYTGIGHPEIQVTPILTEVGAQQIYVLGEVNREGIFEMAGDIDVMQAIAMAGGFNNEANRRSVIIIRRLPDGTVQGQRVNVIGEIRDNQFTMNYLRPYDIVYVPREYIANVNIWIEQYVSRGIYALFDRPIDYWIAIETVREARQ